MMSMRTSCSRNRPTSRAMRMTSAGPCSAASTQSKKSGSLWPVMPRLANASPCNRAAASGGGASIMALQATALEMTASVGVLQKQGVVAHAGPIGEAQEPVPQLALQPGFRGAPDGGPHLAEVGQGAAGGDAVAPELAHDGVRVGPQRFADGNRALQPDQQLPRDLRVGMISAGFDHGSVLHEINDEVGAVGRQPDVVLVGRSLAVGQIPREFFFRGAAFAAQVGLELQDGAAQQGIDPAVDFGDAPLEVDVSALRPEPIHDEAVEAGRGLSRDRGARRVPRSPRCVRLASARRTPGYWCAEAPPYARR